jgi:hypothetical protein
MNRNFLRTGISLLGAVLISVAAGCASVEQALAPSIVAQAQSEDSMGINPELAPGGVDLQKSSDNALAAGSGQLIAGYDIPGPRFAEAGLKTGPNVSTSQARKDGSSAPGGADAGLIPGFDYFGPKF